MEMGFRERVRPGVVRIKTKGEGPRRVGKKIDFQGFTLM